MEQKQKQILIVVVCIVLAVGVTIFTNLGGGGSSRRVKGNKTIQLMCVNEDCLVDYEVTREEFRELMVGQRPMMEISFVCKECDEQTAYIATKCESCEVVFIPDYQATDDYPDRCPDCGYSKTEEERE